MNRQLLKGQLARHGKASWKESDMDYDSIVALTRIYNNEKWNQIIDFRPRRLPVFEWVKQGTVAEPMVAERKVLYKWNGAECTKGVPAIYDGLGYEGKAAGIKKSAGFTFLF